MTKTNHHIIPANSLKHFKIGKSFFALEERGKGWGQAVEINNLGKLTITHLYNKYDIHVDARNSEVEDVFAYIESKISTLHKKLITHLNKQALLIKCSGTINCDEIDNDLRGSTREYINLVYQKTMIYRILLSHNLVYRSGSFTKEQRSIRNKILQSYSKIKFPWPRGFYKIAFIESPPSFPNIISDCPFYIHPNNVDLLSFEGEYEVVIPMSAQWAINIHNSEDVPSESIVVRTPIPFYEDYNIVRKEEINKQIAHNAMKFIGGGDKELVVEYVKKKATNSILSNVTEKPFSLTYILTHSYGEKML